MNDMDREALAAIYRNGVVGLLVLSLLIVIGVTVYTGQAKEGQKLAMPLFFGAWFWPLIAALSLIASPLAIMYVAAWATARITRR